jgi:hypothetical protein
MRLFKENRIYFYAFCVYGLNAFFLLFHSIRGSTQIHRIPNLLVLILECICMLLIVVLALASIGRTTSLVEKTVLILTSGLCLLFLLKVMSELGLRWASLPFSHGVFVAISCATALLAGWRAVVVAREGPVQDA